MRLADEVKEVGLIESPPLLDGRNMVMLLGPTKNAGVKTDAESEDIKRSEEAVQGDGEREAPAPAGDEGHNLEHKSPKRSEGSSQPVAKADVPRLKKLLGMR